MVLVVVGVVVAQSKWTAGSAGDPEVCNLRVSMNPHGTDHAYQPTTGKLTTSSVPGALAVVTTTQYGSRSALEVVKIST